MKATFDDLDKQQLEAIIEYLRQVSGDVSLTLKKTEPGSIKLILEGSEDGFKRIEALFSSGQLNEILGIPVQDVSYVASKHRVRNSPVAVFAVAGGGGVSVSTDLAQNWLLRLKVECPQYSSEIIESIVCWLVGEDLERFAKLDSTQLKVAEQAMEYRYRILRHRYLGLGPERAYRNLTTRLGSLVLVRNKIQAVNYLLIKQLEQKTRVAATDH